MAQIVKCTPILNQENIHDNKYLFIYSQNLINNEKVLEEIDNPHKSVDDFLRDICDSDLRCRHPIFSMDHKAFQIIAYYDDVELANPIGYQVKKHKVGEYKSNKLLIVECHKAKY